MSAATHPGVDYDKAIAKGVETYYEAVETIPYLLEGATAQDMKRLELEEAVKEYKRWCAMEKNENYQPEEKLQHKQVGK